MLEARGSADNKGCLDLEGELGRSGETDSAGYSFGYAHNNILRKVGRSGVPLI